MKLFKITLDNYDYDDYDSCIIVAESKEQVEELCEKNFFSSDRDFIPLVDVENELHEDFDIHGGQKWIITEVDINSITKPTIICSSYNAG